VRLPRLAWRRKGKCHAAQEPAGKFSVNSFHLTIFYDAQSAFRIVKSASALHQNAFSFSGFSFRIAKLQS